MKSFKKIISIALIPLIALFIVQLPNYAAYELHRNRFNEWLMHEDEPFSGSISIWHIVEFKPYIGSLGNLLKAAAELIEKKHFGVYLNIEAMSADEAEGRMAGGEYPDVISFPAGFNDESILQALDAADVEIFESLTECSIGRVNSTTYALPYAASCRLLLYYPAKYTPDETLDIGSALMYSFEDFKKGTVPCCIADARAAGDLLRSVLAGKAEYFEAAPFEDTTELVQYFGICNCCAEEKMPYIIEFFASIYSKHNREAICDLGLLPIGFGDECKYEQDFLEQAYLRIQAHLDQIASFNYHEMDE